MTRREHLKSLSALATFPFMKDDSTKTTPLLQRPIPSTGELLPAIGLGTWQTFDVGNNATAQQPLKEVLQIMIREGGSVVDSSPMYGSSEDVVGKLSTDVGLNEKIFMATKVWTSGSEAGIRQMNESFQLLRRSRLDLMQIHNLVDWNTHLVTLRTWKEQGKVRYIGLTHYLDSAHAELEKIIQQEPIDFIQINYSLLSRHAEHLLQVAADRKVAVLINRPFEEGALFQRAKGKSLPEWAADFDCESWGQFFLKFILSNPAITCVIPGTAKPAHLLDNLQAAKGRLPSTEDRKKMIAWLNA